MSELVNRSTNSAFNILIVDDEDQIRSIVKDVLTDEGYNVFTAEDGSKVDNVLKSERIDICFLDVWMPNLGGIDTLQKIKQEFPGVEVVMISGHAKINLAVKATKLGAFDFIEKPLSIEKLLGIIDNIKISKKTKTNNIDAESVKKDEMISRSESMENIKQLITKSAQSDARILILGENGSGKELVAKEIHIQSGRRNKPFIEINCAAIPENLIESELFGHEKGSFTGAIADRIGKFERADTGTLFMDEVADMSLATQAKVLRVLQEMKFTRIGSTQEISVDVRIIAATNKDLKEEIKNGNFREDLYYRLNVIPFNLPPLRERTEDIPLLIEHFTNRFYADNAKYNKEYQPKSFDKNAIEYMKKYKWPGNVRQLKNIVERLIIMVNDPVIFDTHVSAFLDEYKSLEQVNQNDSRYDSYKLNHAREVFERDFIEKKLIENNYNISKTAAALGIYASNLHSKIGKLGLDVKKLKNDV